MFDMFEMRRESLEQKFVIFKNPIIIFVDT